MKKKWTKSSGFTLAELLIVVAIIAVLVAISIPIFTSQLEKAREATDLSDVRSAYAEVMMAAISDDTTATYSKDPNQTIHKSNGLYSVTVSPLHQEQDNWQGNMDLNVGGVSSKDTTHWIGTPKATGSCEVSYNPQGDSVVLNWSGKSTGGGNTGGGGTVTPGGSTTGGGSTPAPTPGTGGGTSGGTTGGGNTPVPTPGTGGGTSGGTAGDNNNQGNTGGNTGGSTGGNTSGSDQGNNNSNGNSNDNNSDILSPSQITYNQLTTNAEDLPTSDNNYIRGQLYKYNGKLYICNVGGLQLITQWFNPEINATKQFPAFEETYFDNILTDSDLDPASGNFKNQIASGQIYQDKNGNYFMFIASSIPTYSSTPTDSAYGASDKWIPILPDTHKRS